MRLRLVFLTVFVVAACGLGYELVAGAASSYLLGDTITSFSVAIGLYLFALGAGAWLSKFVATRLAVRFVDIELAVALVGGTSAAVLFLAFERGAWFRPILYGEILVIGTLVGLEIPILMRILKDEIDFKDLVAHVLTFDYIGALAVSLVFPLVLVPHLGMVRSAFAFGFVNALVGLWSTWIFVLHSGQVRLLRARAVIVIVVLGAGTFLGDEILDRAETSFYGDEVVFARTTSYQRIVVTRNGAGFQLFLNGTLQFSSADEYRYHEALVHPALAAAEEPRRVLVLGGGDGLALREILVHPEVESVTLVDIDPAMVELGRTFPPLRELNRGAFEDPRVRVVHDDAMRWLDAHRGPFDAAIVDFPDPSSFALGKLYTTAFYERLGRALAPGAAFCVQATSPLAARHAFWCIVSSIEACGFVARPYHAAIPAFGEWGFVLAAPREFPVPTRCPSALRFLDPATMTSMFQIGPDMSRIDVQPNRLDNQILVRYHEEDWQRWN